LQVLAERQSPPDAQTVKGLIEFARKLQDYTARVIAHGADSSLIASARRNLELGVNNLDNFGIKSEKFQQNAEPQVWILRPIHGNAVITHPHCGGNNVRIKATITKLGNGEVIFPYVKNGFQYYIKNPLDEMGLVYESTDGYGDPGNNDEQQEIVFFVAASGQDITTLSGNLGGRPMNSLPTTTTKISNVGATVTLRIRKAGECN
jgi:hypothetical protein